MNCSWKLSALLSEARLKDEGEVSNSRMGM